MNRWPLKEAYFWERIPFFRLLLPLVVGIGLYQYYQHFNSLSIILIFIVATIGYISTAIINKQYGGLKVINNIFLYLSIILAGWLLSYQYDITNDKLWFGNTLGTNNGYAVRVLDKGVEKNRTWKINVAVEKKIDNEEVYKTKGKAILYVYKYTAANYQEGDILIVPDKWQRIKNAGNPYEFDYAKYCAQKNIYYQQFISGKDILQYKITQPKDLPLFRRIHHWCIEQLEYYINDKATLGLLRAMLVGNRSTLDPNIRQAYASTGIVHVLAISGAHITVFFFLVAFLLSFIKHKKYSWVKYIAALPLVWLYVVVAGAPPSAVRAALMFTILGIGFATQKQPNGINQLLATAFILLIAEPMWLFSVGFQLSFLAVLSIMLFYKPIYRLYKPSNRILRAVWSTMVASIAAEILIAPLVIYYFHLFPLQFIVANVLAYCFMSVILIAGMCIIALCSIPTIASSIASVTIVLATYFNQLVDKLQSLNPESFHYLHISGVELVLVYLSITLLAITFISKRRKLVIPSLASLVVLLILFCFHQWQVLNQKHLIVYNTGKVNHVELIEGNKHYIITTDEKLTLENKYYAIKPAHIALHCSRQDSLITSKDLFIIGKDTVLILDQIVNRSNPFKVSYLIINQKIRQQDLRSLMDHYNPKQIVIGGNISRRQATKFKEYSLTNKIPLHIVGIDGAFMLSNR